MKKSLALFVCFLCIKSSVYSQIVNKIPLSDRITGYNINVTLDSVTRTVKGDMDAFWVNKSPDTVREIRMHLYMNAFRSNRTTFYKETGGSPGNEDIDLGWINISSFTDKEGNDMLSRLKFISPDDGNPEDRTVINIELREPALPGDTVFIRTNFETKLPSIIRRTGYNKDFYFFGQWFPKFGVYEPAGIRYAVKGGWNCHQFHGNSEFYSDHSVYNVSLTLPADYVTGSGGILVSESIKGKLKTEVFRAEDIVDFAWTAWRGFAVYNDKWKDINIRLLLPKDRSNQAKRQIVAVKNALEYLDKNVGPYPWPHLTFVDPPAIGNGAGGMEYTTLFTSESSFFVPESLHFPELVTVHEFGHAYFMGILASNEFEEPWLDEGVNSFWECRIMDHYYGARSGVLDTRLLKVPDATYSRLSYTMSPSRQAITNAEYSWNYPHMTYSMMSYLKTSTCLQTLMGIVGEETTNDIFKEYYRKWAFKHPSGRDFINVVNEVVRKEHGDKFGPDMNWFFDETLYGTGICDYKVSGISNRPYHKPEGKYQSSDSISITWPMTDSLFTSTAQLERVGEVQLPVDVLIHFTNGEEILEKWNGKERYKDFTYTGYREIQWVKIDPENKIRMDIDFVNNSMTVEPDKIPMRNLLNKFLSFLQFLISIIVL